MSQKEVINEFINQKCLAVIGVSRNPAKFGNIAYRELKAKGYQVYAIHPEAETLEGDQAFRDFASLPGNVDGLVISVQPENTEKIIRDAAAAGIKRIWMQKGSESPAALLFCKDNGIAEVHGECIMMYAVNTGMHKVHNWVWKVLGLGPK